jgi:DNA integrity scanning protein DisA with diadenylate cyclase activity
MTVDHFMWEYQLHFRIAQQTVAKRVFELLDERFTPEVFLVGILTEPNESRSPACVEPQSGFWARSEFFDATLALASDLREGYSEGKLVQSPQRAERWQDDYLWSRSIKDAIQHIIESLPERPSDVTYFIAHPAKVEGYLVSIVLGLQTLILEKHPSLKRNSVPINEYRSVRVPTSLIDAVTLSYLEKASGELRLPHPGSGMSEVNAEEVLSDGANRLMAGLAYRADQNCMDGWSGVFSSCTNVARTYYEGAAGIGTMVLASRDHPNLDQTVRFNNTPRLRTTRAARKLLQLASRGFALHTDSEKLYGLVKVKGYASSNENLFSVRFLGHHHWQVLHEEQVLMLVQYGQPYLPIPPFDENKLRKDLPKIFRKMTDKHIDRIVGLVHEAEKEKHGTMLMISEGAKSESQRMASQGTPITPKVLTPELLRNLTPIDGAVLLSPKGVCYAIGVILDGMATDAGDSARGARYNSAIRYVMSSKYRNLAVIVSEDGSVEFFPNPLPMIRRSDIERSIVGLRNILTDKTLDRAKYSTVMHALDQNRFYLLPQHCEEINRLVRLIDRRMAAEDPTGMRIVRSEFVPHPDMDIDLYYESEEED